MRQSASSSASSTTDSNASVVHGLLMSGGTASRITFGARASGAVRFAVTAPAPVAIRDDLRPRIELDAGHGTADVVADEDGAGHRSVVQVRRETAARPSARAEAASTLAT